MVVTEIDNGDWIALSHVDFGAKGASSFTATVAGATGSASIDIRLDSPNGKSIGTLPVSEATGEDWKAYTTKVVGANGVHDLYLIFEGTSAPKRFKLKNWQFGE
jgi:arabinoxylan arabinofuranohydrolase